MNSFVLDASVALAWLIDAAIGPYAMHVRQLLQRGSRAIVPALWQWEVANGFVVAERRGLLTPSDTAEILQSFEATLGYSIEVKHESIPVRRVIVIARESHLTAYDAAYLALAKEQQLPLATLDRGLAEAAKQARVSLLH